MSHLWNDLRFALRTLGKRPGFTLAAALSLGLGIGANTAVFSLVDALLLRALPLAEPERLVAIYTQEGENPADLPLSHLNFKDLRAGARSFSGVAGFDWAPLSVTVGGGEAERVMGQLVSEGYFAVLGARPALGRAFTPEEEAPAGPPVAVVSDRFFRLRLGGDPRAVGQAVGINGTAFTVVGVMGRRFTGTDALVAPEVWVPMAKNRLIRLDPARNWYETRGPLFVGTVARLKPGVAIAAARAEIGTVAARLARDFPAENRPRRLLLLPFSQATMNPAFRRTVGVASGLLSGLVGLVLLIACANVANLELVRMAARRREIAIRLSQGASRGRLVAQLLTESVVLALLGSTLGLALAAGAIRAFAALLQTLPFPVPVAIDLGLDGRVLAYTLAVAVLTGLLFGLAPALQSTRPELVSALKSQAGGEAPGRRRFGLRGTLVAFQVGLSLVALTAAGLFVASLRQAERIDPGFDAPRLAGLSFDLSLTGLDPAHGEEVLRQVLDGARSLPGITGATLASTGPFQPTVRLSVLPEEESGQPERGQLAQTSAVDPDYFRTLGIRLEAGRGFASADRAGGAPVVVVNHTLATRLWPTAGAAGAVGRRLVLLGSPAPVTVVGVARDAIYSNPGEPPQLYVYFPLAQSYSPGVMLVARTDGDPAVALPVLARAVRARVRGMPLTEVSTVGHLLDKALWAPRLGAGLLTLFGGLALVLAAVGLYGVLSAAVASRSREIGIRMALGSSRRAVLGRVVRQGMLWVAVGLAVGMAVAFALLSRAAGLLIGVSPTDPGIYAATALALAAVGLVAALVPARRALAIDPLAALRTE